MQLAQVFNFFLYTLTSMSIVSRQMWHIVAVHEIKLKSQACIDLIVTRLLFSYYLHHKLLCFHIRIVSHDCSLVLPPPLSTSNARIKMKKLYVAYAIETSPIMAFDLFSFLYIRRLNITVIKTILPPSHKECNSGFFRQISGSVKRHSCSQLFATYCQFWHAIQI